MSCTGKKLREEYRLEEAPQLHDRYNIAPSQSVAAVRATGRGRVFAQFRSFSCLVRPSSDSLSHRQLCSSPCRHGASFRTADDWRRWSEGTHCRLGKAVFVVAVIGAHPSIPDVEIQALLLPLSVEYGHAPAIEWIWSRKGQNSNSILSVNWRP